MPLVAMISDAINKVRGLIPQVSAVHLCAATLDQARVSVFIFTSPESILDGSGRTLLQDNTVATSIRAIFVDEFHIVHTW